MTSAFLIRFFYFVLEVLRWAYSNYEEAGCMYGLDSPKHYLSYAVNFITMEQQTSDIAMFGEKKKSWFGKEEQTRSKRTIFCWLWKRVWLYKPSWKLLSTANIPKPITDKAAMKYGLVRTWRNHLGTKTLFLSKLAKEMTHGDVIKGNRKKNLLGKNSTIQPNKKPHLNPFCQTFYKAIFPFPLLQSGLTDKQLKLM